MRARNVSVLYADPPWNYLSGTKKSGMETPYPTMKTSAICALKDEIKPCLAPDCVLLLWATGATLPDALNVIDAWGFEYVTMAFNWVKSNKKGELIHGLIGKYTLLQSEICLLGRRGKYMKPKVWPDQVIVAERRKHSQKPEIVRELIEMMWPDASRMELFSRSTRKGWTMWGNQIVDNQAVVNTMSQAQRLLISDNVPDTTAEECNQGLQPANYESGQDEDDYSETVGS